MYFFPANSLFALCYALNIKVLHRPLKKGEKIQGKFRDLKKKEDKLLFSRVYF